MPRRELWTLRAGGLSAPAEQVWVERSPRSQLVSVSNPDEQGSAKTSVVVRMRWRANVSLASVLIDAHGETWHVNESTEVGSMRWLDVAITTYEMIDTAPPADTTLYTPQTGYTLSRDGAAIQYLQVFEEWTVTSSTTGETLPRGWILRNRGAAGVIPGGVWFRAPTGAEGQLALPVPAPRGLPGSDKTRAQLGTVTADDEIIPESRADEWSYAWTFRVAVDNRAARPLTWTPAVGDWFRILSAEEVPTSG